VVDYMPNGFTNQTGMEENRLIADCLSGDRTAQKKLFDRYAPKMLGVSRRYVKDPAEAEDVMIRAMYKVLTKLETFDGNGSFEGWVRRITVNEALMHLRKRKGLHTEELSPRQPDSGWSVLNELYHRDLIAVLDQLPVGYRLVFNLYVIEGYKHREIADLLGISINTSKSQLILAKQKLKAILTNYDTH